MRKGQKELIHKGQKYGFTDIQMQWISDENKSLSEIRKVYDIAKFSGNNDHLFKNGSVEKLLQIFCDEKSVRLPWNNRNNSIDERLSCVDDVLHMCEIMSEEIQPYRVLSKTMFRIVCSGETVKEAAKSVRWLYHHQLLKEYYGEVSSYAHFLKEVNWSDDAYSFLLRQKQIWGEYYRLVEEWWKWRKQNPDAKDDEGPKFPSYPVDILDNNGAQACIEGKSVSEYETRLFKIQTMTFAERLKEDNPYLYSVYLELKELNDKYLMDEGTRIYLEKASKCVPCGIKMSAQVSGYTLNTFEQRNGFCFVYSEYKNTIFTNGGELKGAYPKFLQKSIVVFDDGIPYISQNGKLVPASLRSMSMFLKNDIIHGYMKDLLNAIWKYDYSNGAIQTIIGQLIDDSVCPLLPPISFKSIKGKKSLNEAMRPLYKRAVGLNWNKVGVRIGYAVAKSLNLLNEKSKRKLVWLANNGTIENMLLEQDYLWKNMNKKDNYTWLIVMLITDNIRQSLPEMVSLQEALIMVNDLVNMMKVRKRKISLYHEKKKKIKSLHDDVILDEINSHTCNIRKRKYSQFDNLRKILPKQFEWIRTKKRLILEGAEMRHCVASYASRVDGDESAIFSFYLLDHYEGRKEPTRYTAEFIVSKYKHEKFVYKVRQIQAKADEGASKEA